MKLLTVQIKNFISIKKVLLDFRKFKPGVFLISGPTGSGKSTILDAIHWALYGVTLNHNRTQNNGILMSDYAGPDEVLEVDLTFDQDGVVYRALRSAVKDGHTTLRFYTPNKIYDKVKEGNKAIEDVVGLTARQFDQMVMLEQGNFSKFLLTDSKDRAALLRNVFDTQLFQNIEQAFKARVDNLKQELENLNNLELALLGGQTLDSIKIRTDGAEERCASLDKELSDKKKELSELQALLPRLHEYESARQVYEIAQRELSELSERKDEISRIEKCKMYYEAYYSSLLLYNKCMALRDALFAARQTISMLQEEIKALPTFDEPLRDVRELQAELAKIGRMITDSTYYQNLSSSIQTKKVDISSLLTKQETLAAELDVVEGQLGSAETNYGIRITYESDYASWTQKKEKVEKKKAELESVQAKLDELKYAYASALKSRLLEISEPGVCPICGGNYSTCEEEHSDISLDDFQKLQGKVTSLTEWLDGNPIREEPACSISESSTSLRSIVDNLKSDLRHKQQEYNTVRGQYQEATRVLAELEEDFSRLPRIEMSIEELRQEEQRLQTEIEATLEEQEKRDKVDRKRFELQSRVDASEELIKQRLDEAKVNGVPTDPEKCSDFLPYRIFIEEYAENQGTYLRTLEEYKAKVAQLLAVQEPKRIYNLTVLECTTKINMLQLSIQEIITEVATIQSNLENDKKLITQVEEIRDKREKMIPIMKEYTYIYTQISGKNSAKLSLENFVLHRQLEWILDTSNQFLATLSNNQFVLNIRWESSGRSQGGLEISILDRTTGKSRLAQTFSGGELFILSLSLSLGLMSSIDSLFSGITLDLLICDEGFGTLDPECLSRVLSALQSIRNISTVGIISHVQELIESIPQGFLVEKTLEGTVVKQFSN